MTIWAVYAFAIILMARLLGASPADWPGVLLLGDLVRLMPY